VIALGGWSVSCKKIRAVPQTIRNPTSFGNLTHRWDRRNRETRYLLFAGKARVGAARVRDEIMSSSSAGAMRWMRGRVNTYVRKSLLRSSGQPIVVQHELFDNTIPKSGHLSGTPAAAALVGLAKPTRTQPTLESSLTALSKHHHHPVGETRAASFQPITP
jgi:hypothetical protein